MPESQHQSKVRGRDNRQEGQPSHDSLTGQPIVTDRAGLRAYAWAQLGLTDGAAAVLGCDGMEVVDAQRRVCPQVYPPCLPHGNLTTTPRTRSTPCDSATSGAAKPSQ